MYIYVYTRSHVAVLNTHKLPLIEQSINYSGQIPNFKKQVLR